MTTRRRCATRACWSVTKSATPPWRGSPRRTARAGSRPRSTVVAPTSSCTLSLPIFSDGQVIGGINLYASTANAFTGHHDQLADALGASASEVVTNADLSFATRLRAARAPAQLRATQQIETAAGLLAARYGQDVDGARARLRDAAARAGVEEALVARLMILVHSDDADANP